MLLKVIQKHLLIIFLVDAFELLKIYCRYILIKRTIGIHLQSNFDKELIMAGTSLKRKARKNRVVAKKRVDNIQRLQQQPVIKNVDIEAVKAEFEKADKKKPAAKKEDTAKAEKKEEAPKAKKAAPKKAAAPKKEEAKTEDKPKASKKKEDKKED